MSVYLEINLFKRFLFVSVGYNYLFSRKQMLPERWTILEYFNRVDFVYYTAIYVNI